MQVALSPQSKVASHLISSDTRHLYIKRVSILQKDDGLTINYEVLNAVSIHFRTYYKGVESASNLVKLDFKSVEDVKEQTIDITSNIDADFPIDKISFELDKNFVADVEITLYLSTNVFHPTEDPELTFKTHLLENYNSKILFSAPFGKGKTSFIKHYFSKRPDDYSVFHLFPVNYSIADNKDILEYIKCEVLFQLLGQPVEFDKQTFSHLEVLPDYVKKNSFNLFAPFLKLIPGVGGAVYDINENLNELQKEYFGELESDDKKEATSYLERFYEESGSLYEDNFITQLIRQLLEQLKESSGGENVLVIDDLDRMDPDHIFRILNVFAAHFDHKSKEQQTNKFGFDKVIIVCDYHNLEKIFAHKFGEKTDFSGYIDKFYSKGVFHFSQYEAMKYYLSQWQSSQGMLSDIAYVVLNDLNQSGGFSFRELFSLMDLDFEKEFRSLYDDNTSRQRIVALLSLLLKVVSKSRLIEKLENCYLEISRLSLYEMVRNRTNYDYSTRYVFLEIAKNTDVLTGVVLYNINEKEVSISGSPDEFREENYLQKVKITDSKSNAVDSAQKFDMKDFYAALVELVKLVF